ncbi:MAG: SurA N-terminal domain-containing protein [Candidatus Vogelbacteria bacterium]|nr:SurA N-terminal domain-containing protein [Candidatus Vogelbacteria bacterium]
MKNKNLLIGVLILLVVALGGYVLSGRTDKATDNINSKTNGGISNTSGVAVVNGAVLPKAVYDAQLANAIASYKAQGVDVTNVDKLSQIKSQVLDSLINNELLFQNVVASNVRPSAADIDKQVQLVITQIGGADAFKAELVKENTTEAQLRQNIAQKLAIQMYLAQNIDTKSLAASDTEIAQFYATYSKTQKASGQKNLPTLKTLSDKIKQQIIANKQQALVTNFVASLRAKAKIELTSAGL